MDMMKIDFLDKLCYIRRIKVWTINLKVTPSYKKEKYLSFSKNVKLEVLTNSYTGGLQQSCIKNNETNYLSYLMILKPRSLIALMKTKSYFKATLCRLAILLKFKYFIYWQYLSPWSSFEIYIISYYLNFVILTKHDWFNSQILIIMIASWLHQ